MARPRKKIIETIAFAYLDYRVYLRDLLSEHKAKIRGFNLRAFCQEAGLRSPGLVKMVVDGDRRLTPKLLAAFCRGFGVSVRERHYLEVLADYQHADDPDEKRLHFVKLARLRPRSRSYVLEKKQARYLTNDHYVTIREMIDLKDFSENYEWIASRCSPQITAGEAKAAVAELLDLGLLARDESGRLIQAQGHVATTDANTQAIEAYHFHEAVLNKARAALTNVPQEQRSFQSLTISLPRTLLPEIVAEYNRLRDWLLERSQLAGQGDEVYQVAFQIFPVTGGGK